MSLRVVGYQDGHRIVVDDGPSFGRVQGVGGAAIGYFSGTTLTAKQQRDNAPKRRPRQPLKRNRVLCGKQLPRAGALCARTQGHAGPRSGWTGGQRG